MNYGEKIESINAMIREIDNIYMDICRTDSEKAYTALSKILTDIAGYMTEFMEKIPVLKQYSIDIPQEVLLSQLQNLLEAFENRDYVMMADTLHYEINDSLQFYVEIMEECKKENLQL